MGKKVERAGSYFAVVYAIRLAEGRSYSPGAEGDAGSSEMFLVFDSVRDVSGAELPRSLTLVEVPGGAEPLNRLASVRSEMDALRLGSQWGFLRDPQQVRLANGCVWWGEPVGLWLREASLLRDCIRMYSSDPTDYVWMLDDGTAVVASKPGVSVQDVPEGELSIGTWVDGAFIRRVLAETVGEAVVRFLSIVVQERLQDVRFEVGYQDGAYRMMWLAKTLLGHCWLTFSRWLLGSERFEVCSDCAQVFQRVRAGRLPQPLCPKCAQRRCWRRFVERRGGSRWGCPQGFATGGGV